MNKEVRFGSAVAISCLIILAALGIAALRGENGRVPQSPPFGPTDQVTAPVSASTPPTQEAISTPVLEVMGSPQPTDTATALTVGQRLGMREALEALCPTISGQLLGDGRCWSPNISYNLHYWSGQGSQLNSFNMSMAIGEGVYLNGIAPYVVELYQQVMGVAAPGFDDGPAWIASAMAELRPKLRDPQGGHIQEEVRDLSAVLSIKPLPDGTLIIDLLVIDRVPVPTPTPRPSCRPLRWTHPCTTPLTSARSPASQVTGTGQSNS